MGGGGWAFRPGAYFGCCLFVFLVVWFIFSIFFFFLFFALTSGYGAASSFLLRRVGNFCLSVIAVTHFRFYCFLDFCVFSILHFPFFSCRGLDGYDDLDIVDDVSTFSVLSRLV